MALHNPEIIPFGEFECQQVHINVLKTPPDESDRQVASWRSINLMEALLHLGDDPSLREGVKDLISIGKYFLLKSFIKKISNDIFD